ncbi:MAG: OmpA family protein [Desulfuromonadaceae bacterium]
MKKVITLCLAGMLLSMTTAATAANKAETFSISPIIGGITFEGKLDLETSPLYGARLGYNFTKALGVEALFDYANTEGTKYSGTGNVDYYRYGGDVLYHFMPDDKLVPYVAAGYAAYNFKGVKALDSASRPHGVFDYGAGLKYFVTDNFALRGDVRHLIYKHNGAHQAFEYTVGFYIPFGGHAPAAKPVEPPPAPVPAAKPTEEPPEAVLAPIPAAEPAPEHFKYCITLHTEFDVDKTEIRPEYRDEIAKVGNFMKQYPTTTAVIEGHTDNVGDAEYNRGLSQRRAESVVNHLVETYGIDRTRLTAKGYGMANPVADNTTDAGKQANRRIEAIIDCAFDVKKVTPPDRLCMNLNMEFDTGKTDIKPQYQDEIAKVGDFMKQYPTTTAVIEGHTDNVGSSDYNMKLSQQRAENVVDYLVKNFGIEKSRLEAKGYGYTRRIAYNSTPEGRQKNRRINAIIDCVIKK